MPAAAANVAMHGKCELLFHRIWTLCNTHGILPVLALQSGTPRDPVVQYACRIGFLPTFHRLFQVLLGFFGMFILGVN